MAQRYRLSQLRLKSDTANRSGLVTENMTSATADKVVGTTFKNILANENGEFVVGAAIATPSTPLSVTGNTFGDVTSMVFRGENDTGALNTATATVAQKVFRQQTVSAGVLTDTVIVENYVDNTLYVDLQYGSNTTGLRERADRPFATVAAAVTASVSGDTIVLRNGSYAIGTVNIIQNTSIIAEEGVVWTAGVYNLTDGVSFSYRGGSVNKSGNSIQLGQNNIVHFDVKRIILSGSNFFRNNVGGLTNGTQVYFNSDYVNNTGATSTLFSVGPIDNAIIDIRIKKFEGDYRIIQTTTCSGAKVNSNIDIMSCPTLSSSAYSANAGGTGSEWNIRGISYNLGLVGSSRFVFIAGGGTTNVINIDVDNYVGSGTILYVRTTLDSRIQIKGKKHLYTGNVLPIFLESASAAIGAITARNKVYIDIDECEYTFNTSTTNGGGYTPNRVGSSLTGGPIFGVYGSTVDLICKGQKWINAKNELIGLDMNVSLSGFTADIDINYMEKTALDVGGYNGVIFVDEGGSTNTGIINFVQGTRVFNGGDNQLIGGLDTAGTTVIVNYYDFVTTNTTSNYSGISTINYLYQPTKTITASGTYTVLDSDDDLYYDLTLGSLTLVLPDPSKYINREIQLKVTGTHASNTIVVDPAGTAQIENALTWIVPGTSTKLVNIVFKSQNGAWRIK